MDAKFLLTILVGLITAGIWAFLVWLVTRLPWAPGWRMVLVAGLIGLMAVTALIPLYFYWHTVPEDMPGADYGRTVLLRAILAQIFIGYALFFVLKNTRKRQYGRAFDVVRKATDTIERAPIAVRSIFQWRMPASEQLYLSWQTFGDGIKILEKQIQGFAPSLSPDLCVGINNAGTIIASHLAGRLRIGRTVGSIETRGQDHRTGVYSLPDSTGDISGILLVDSEVAEGNSIRNCYNFLKDRYPNADVNVVVLVACHVKGKIKTIDDLLLGKAGAFKNKIMYLPDFLAFITQGKIEPPEGIR